VPGLGAGGYNFCLVFKDAGGSTWNLSEHDSMGAQYDIRHGAPMTTRVRTVDRRASVTTGAPSIAAAYFAAGADAPLHSQSSLARPADFLRIPRDTAPAVISHPVLARQHGARRPPSTLARVCRHRVRTRLLSDLAAGRPRWAVCAGARRAGVRPFLSSSWRPCAATSRFPLQRHLALGGRPPGRPASGRGGSRVGRAAWGSGHVFLV
jgi:hypothetical protein